MKLENGSSVAENTLKVLMLFSHGQLLTIKEISVALDINITSVYRIINTMEYMGFIEKDNNKKYKLKLPHIIRLYEALDFELNNSAIKVLNSLVGEFSESVYLSELCSDDSFMFIEKQDSPFPLKWSENIRELYRLPTGTAGKTHMAYKIKDYSTDQKISAVDIITLPKYTQRTITSTLEIIESFNEIVKNGYCITRGEHLEGVIGICVPIIRGESGDVKNTLCMFIPTSRFNEEMLPNYINALKKGAKELSYY